MDDACPSFKGMGSVACPRGRLHPTGAACQCGRIPLIQAMVLPLIAL